MYNKKNKNCQFCTFDTNNINNIVGADALGMLNGWLLRVSAVMYSIGYLMLLKWDCVSVTVRQILYIIYIYM